MVVSAGWALHCRKERRRKVRDGSGRTEEKTEKGWKGRRRKEVCGVRKRRGERKERMDNVKNVSLKKTGSYE